MLSSAERCSARRPLIREHSRAAAPLLDGLSAFTNDRLRTDLAGTAIPHEFAFNILLQNCVERQAVYERAFRHQPEPDMPARTLLSSEQRIRLFAIPTDPAEMARHYVLERRRPGAHPDQAARRSTGSGSPSSFASCAIRASGWDPAEHPA